MGLGIRLRPLARMLFPRDYNRYLLPLTGIQLVADISAPHHFLVFCHIFASFWRKIKVDIDLESGESRASI